MNGLTTAVGLVLAAVLPALKTMPATTAKPEVAGRWNLTVGDPPHTHPSWLAVDAKGGKLVGRFLGRLGSVGDIGEVKFEKATLKFNTRGHKWTGTLEGDIITGTRTNDKGEQAKWVGKRSVRQIHLNGKWCLKIERESVAHLPVLTLTQQGDTVAASLKTADKTTELTGGRLVQDRLTFSDPGAPGELVRRTYWVKVEGDLLAGIIMEPRRRYPFKGYRQREWGEPVKLFNGKDLDGWKPLDNPDNFHWKVIDGIMTNTGGRNAANIVSEREFRNFRIHLEFKVPEGGNSGVFLRGRHEIQIADSFGHDPSWHDCGALYSRIPPNLNAARKHDQWQELDVTVIESYLTVILNGQLIIDNEEMEGITGGAIDSRENEPGPIYLQGDHGQISYRNITIWPATE